MDLETLIKTIDNRQMMIIPIAVLAIALMVLGYTFATTGSPVKLGIEFTGGTSITVPATESMEAVQAKLQGYPVVEIRQIGYRYMVQLGPMSETQYSELAKLVNQEFKDAEIRYMGPIYSKILQSQALSYLPLSFILMSLVVFVIFRQPIVSGIIVICALVDITMAAGFMTLVGVKLSLGTVAALLMLIGYSVDTDILLTVRVLKRKGVLQEKVLGSMRTGLMMTATTLVAVISLMVVSSLLYHLSPSFSRIDIIADITIVLFFGLLADMMNTWITNVQALKWYLSRPSAATTRRGKR